MDYVALKKEHGAICVIPIGPYEIIYRPLSWQEFDIYEKVLLMDLTQEGELAFKFFKEICVDSTMIDQVNLLPAGIVYTFMRAVLLLSGNSLRTEPDLQRYNEDISLLEHNLENNPYEKAIQIICKAFPGQTPALLERMPYYDMMRMLVMGSQILGLESPKIMPKKQKSTITDQIFNDVRRAQGVDSSKPNKANIKDLIEENRERKASNQPGMNAAQEEAIRRVRAERARRV